MGLRLAGGSFSTWLNRLHNFVSLTRPFLFTLSTPSNWSVDTPSVLANTGKR